MKFSSAFHQQLYQTTRPLHQTAEQQRLSQKLLMGQMQLDEYKAYLQLFWVLQQHLESFFKQFAAPLQTIAEPGFCLNNYSRLVALRRDLLLLQSIATSATLHQRLASLQGQLPERLPINNLPQFIGVFYVLTGSIMGGQHLKHKAPSVTPTIKANLYLAGFAEQNMPLWQGFTTLLQNVTERSIQQQIIDSANACFQQVILGLAAIEQTSEQIIGEHYA